MPAAFLMAVVLAWLPLSTFISASNWACWAAFSSKRLSVAAMNCCRVDSSLLWDASIASNRLLVASMELLKGDFELIEPIVSSLGEL